MKKKLLIPSLLLLSLCACNDTDRKPPESENDADAARNFIRSALDGKFDEAKTYMVADSLNLQYLDAVARSYSRLSDSTIKGYRQSSITVYNADAINDSTTIVIYDNSYKKDKDTLKVLKINNQWLVDLKYLYEHNMDTAVHKPHTDTLR
jgi:hypothetical protein